MEFDDFNPDSLDGAKIRKHNHLIEAKYQIPNLQEQRVILMLLAQIKPSDEDFKGYRIAVSDFARIVGVRADNLYERLESTAQSLLSRTIKIKQGRSFLMANWLSSAEYKHGSGYMELCFDPKLKPYLLQLKDHFTQYQLETVFCFKGLYSLRLYESLKHHAFKIKQDRRVTVEFSYSELRAVFGIDKKEYTKFNDFKRKAIEPAVAEVTAKTELNIYAVEYGKTGRAVSRVTFRVEVRELSILDERAALLAVEQQAEKTSKELLCDKLTALGYGAAAARKDVNKYGVKRIERNLAYTLAKQQEGKLSDVPAFLATAIALDYGNQWETQLFEQHEHEAQQRAQEAAQAAAKAKAQQEHRANSKAALAAFYALPAHEQTAVALAFMMQETDLLYQQLFADQMALGEVKDRTLKARLAAFLLKRGK